MSLTRRNAGDGTSRTSLAGSLAVEVLLEGIKGVADMSETGVTGIGMSRHGAVAMTAMVEGAEAPRDVGVATGTRVEGDSANMLYDRHKNKS